MIVAAGIAPDAQRLAGSPGATEKARFVTVLTTNALAFVL